jgi:seryl-tRNA synthetase
MIELKRSEARGDPQREAKAWLDKLAEIDRKRSGYIDLAADGIMDRDELHAKLAALEETRKTAQRELEALSRRQEEIEELERDRDALLEYYTDTPPEALESRTPEQRHHIYKMGRFEALAYAGGTIELTGPLVPNHTEICKTEPTPWRCTCRCSESSSS